jgi:hypothetical protein
MSAEAPETRQEPEANPVSAKNRGSQTWFLVGLRCFEEQVFAQAFVMSRRRTKAQCRRLSAEELPCGLKQRAPNQ